MVGYRDPPKNTRFKPGVSGNPSGSRKRKVDFASILLEPVEIVVGGKKQTVEAFKAQLYRQLQDALIKRDLRALRAVYNTLSKYGALQQKPERAIGGIVVLRDNLPLDLRNRLCTRLRGRLMTLSEMDAVRTNYFASAEERDVIREQLGGYTSNAEFRALQQTSLQKE